MEGNEQELQRVVQSLRVAVHTLSQENIDLRRENTSLLETLCAMRSHLDRLIQRVQLENKP